MNLEIWNCCKFYRDTHKKMKHIPLFLMLYEVLIMSFSHKNSKKSNNNYWLKKYIFMKTGV